jgi:hypothetical protein
MRCDHCGETVKEGGIGCDWQQGRCPHRFPMLTSYHLRYFNLFNTIKKWFKRG